MSIDTSNGVYKILRETVGSWFKERGFKRTKRGMGWYKELENGYLVFLFSCLRSMEVHRGGALTVHLRVTDEINPGRNRSKATDLSWSLTELLNADQLEAIRGIQNEVLKTTTLPPDSGYGFHWREYLAQENALIDSPYTVGQDVALRFTHEDHLRDWASHLLTLCPKLFEQIEAEWNAERPNVERVPVNLETRDYKPWEAIVNAPDDDTPRLIYADWLDEQGEARAEFIRAQCQLANIEELDENRSLRYRTRQLEEENFRQWTGEIEKLPVSEPVFRRGFIEEVTITHNQFVKNLGTVIDQLPLLRCVHIKAASNDLAAEGDRDAMSRLRGVGLMRPKIYWHAAQIWDPFFRGQHWVNLQRLDLVHWRYLGPSLHNREFDFPMPKLSHLNLNFSGLGNDIQRILTSPLMPQLKTLTLVKNNFSSQHAKLLAACEGLSELEELSLNRNSIGNKGVAAIAESPHFSKLKVFRIADNRLTKKVARCLLDSKNLSSLVRIQVTSHELTEEARNELATRYCVSQF